MTDDEFVLRHWFESDAYIATLAAQNLYVPSGPSRPALIDYKNGYANQFTSTDFAAVKAGDKISVGLQNVITLVDNQWMPQGGYVHDANFIGTVGPVPLPATGAMLTGGLALLWRRRRA